MALPRLRRALIVVGVVAAVGAYPYSEPTPFGNVIKTAGSDSTWARMRSSNRIVPIDHSSDSRSSSVLGFPPGRPSPWLGLGALALSVALVRPTCRRCGTALVASNLDRPSAAAELHHRRGQVPQRSDVMTPGSSRSPDKTSPTPGSDADPCDRSDDALVPHARCGPPGRAAPSTSSKPSTSPSKTGRSCRPPWPNRPPALGGDLLYESRRAIERFNPHCPSPCGSTPLHAPPRPPRTSHAHLVHADSSTP